MSGYTFDGYATVAGLGPLPALPTSPVWGPDVELDGSRWLDFWDLVNGLGPAPTPAPNPPSRIDLRHGSNAPGMPWVAVSTIPKFPTFSRTSLMDAVLNVELRLNGTLHMPVRPLTATTEDLYDPTGRWRAQMIALTGDGFDGWITKFGDAWGAAVELESVYLGITASKVPLGYFGLSVRQPVSV